MCKLVHWTITIESVPKAPWLSIHLYFYPAVSQARTHWHTQKLSPEQSTDLGLSFFGASKFKQEGIKDIVVFCSVLFFSGIRQLRQENAFLFPFHIWLRFSTSSPRTKVRVNFILQTIASSWAAWQKCLSGPNKENISLIIKKYYFHQKKPDLKNRLETFWLLI